MFLRMDSFVLLFIRDVWMDRGQNPHPSLYLFHVNELFVFYYKRKKERKKKDDVISHVCFLCKLEGEPMDHILLHCTKARILWHLMFSLFV